MWTTMIEDTVVVAVGCSGDDEANEFLIRISHFIIVYK